MQALRRRCSRNAAVLLAMQHFVMFVIRHYLAKIRCH
jgi:hypothetical protein